MSGLRVVVHTAEDCEVAAQAPVVTCRCVSWHRGVRPALLRRVAIATSYIGRTLPHLVSNVASHDVAHFQGWYKGVLSWATLAMLHRRCARTVLSPHNTFSRGGGRLDARILRHTVRSVDAVVAYSGADAGVVTRWGAKRSVVAPLVLPMPVDAELVREWHARWGGDAGRRVALFAGQVRPDKRLDLAIEAARSWGPECMLAVVGEDKGDADRCRALADRHGVQVHWSVGYVSLPEFASAVAAADVVLCPYDRASQSGVLALATQLGVPTVVRDVGGLGEAGTAVVQGGDPAHLAAAVDRILHAPRPARLGDRLGTVIGPMLSAYGLDRHSG